MINNSTNPFTADNSNTSSSHKKYVFIPKETFISRIIIYSLLTVFALYAIVANSLILHFKRNQRRKLKERRAFDRFPVVGIYVQSLASSDLLCGIITAPVAISNSFSDFINDDMVCKVVRFSNIFLPVVTMCNLFVIGIERYLAVFHPFVVPSKRIVRGLVVGAWIAGGLIALVPTATFSLQIRDIEPDRYTNICIYDKSVPLYRVLFIGFTVGVYLIPGVILSFTSLRMFIFLRKRMKGTFPSESGNKNASRFHGSFTFVALIFTFFLPYFLYVFFSILNIILNFNLNYTAEYILRRTSALLAYSNSALSPSVMFYNMPDLRKDLADFIGKYICRYSSTNHENNSNANSVRQKRNISENENGTENHIRLDIQPPDPRINRCKTDGDSENSSGNISYGLNEKIS